MTVGRVSPEEEGHGGDPNGLDGRSGEVSAKAGGPANGQLILEDLDTREAWRPLDDGTGGTGRNLQSDRNMAGSVAENLNNVSSGEVVHREGAGMSQAPPAKKTNQEAGKTTSFIGPLCPHSPRRLDFLAFRATILAAAFALMGSLVSCLENEIVVRGGSPDSDELNAVKAVGTLFTLLTLLTILYLYYINFFNTKLRKSLRGGVTSARLEVSVSLSELLSSRSLWQELLVCGIHSPPFVTFEVPISTSTNFVLYRSETLLSIWTMTRVYHVFRVFREVLLVWLPKRRAIEMVHNMELRSLFALKIYFQGICSFFNSMVVGVLSACILAYAMRGVEVSACFFGASDADPYAVHTASDPRCHLPIARLWKVGMMDAEIPASRVIDYREYWWMVLTTCLTIGFGDIVPVTHFGRVIGLAAIVVGIVLLAMMTTSLCQSVPWTVDEQKALIFLEKNKMALRMQKLAAKLIIRAWRQFKGKKQHHGIFALFSDHKAETKRIWEEFVDVRFQVNRDDEEKQGMDGHIHAIEQRISIVEDAVGHIRQQMDSQTAKKPAERRSNSVDGADVHSFELTSTVSTYRLISSKSKRLKDSLQNRIKDSKSKSKSASTLPIILEYDDAVSLRTLLSGSPVYSIAARSRSLTKRNICRGRLATFVFAMASIALEVSETVLIFRGVAFDSTAMNVLKGLDSFAVALSLFAVYMTHKHCVHAERIDAHIKSMGTLNLYVGPRDVFARPFFWLEVVLLCMHLPPACTYEMRVDFMPNLVMYRGETIMSIVGMMKQYTFMPILREMVLGDFRKRHVVSRMTGIGTLFACKRVVNRVTASRDIGLLFLWLIVGCGYTFQCMETSACWIPGAVRDSVDFCERPEAWTFTMHGKQWEPSSRARWWDSFWLMIVASTTVGYGDNIPLTYSGRAVLGFMAIAGLSIVSLLTASIAAGFRWSLDEQRVLGTLEQEISERDLQRAAATSIYRWWAKKRNKPVRTIVPKKVKATLRKVRRNIVAMRDSKARSEGRILSVLQRSKSIAENVKAIQKHLNMDGAK